MRRLSVKNFGPIKDVNIEIKQFNLFIGEQCVGKSTIAKLIAIFTDYFSLGNLIQEGHTAWRLLVDSFDMSHYIKEHKEYILEYHWEENEWLFLVTITAENVDIYCEVAGNVVKDKFAIGFETLRKAPIFHDSTTISLNKLRKENPEEMAKMLTSVFRDALYIPAERSVGGYLKNLLPALNLVSAIVPKNMLRYLTEWNNARAAMNDIEIPLFGVKYSNSQDEDWIVLSEDNKIQLPNTSSGMQSTIPLLLVSMYGVNEKEYASFVVEEPECNLFPQKQVELLRTLVGMVYHNGRMLTITTHSPYILTALNTLILANERLKESSEMKEKVSKYISEEFTLPYESVAAYGMRDGKSFSIMDDEYRMVSAEALDLVSEQLDVDYNYLLNL